MILDTNIVIGIVDADMPLSFNERIAELRHHNELVINEIVYAELAAGYATIEELDQLVASLDLRIERLPLRACQLAGRAFADYKRRDGTKRRMLPDFLIGAHAAFERHTLVTRDRRGYASYFPELTIIDPLKDIA